MLLTLTRPWRPFLRGSLIGLGVAAVLSTSPALAETAGSRVPPPIPAHASSATRVAPTLHKTIKVGGLDIFYREAGAKDAPAILLLHGFPTSSQMLDTGHFALEEDGPVIADHIRRFLGTHVLRETR
jgi:hypothetical protein